MTLIEYFDGVSDMADINYVEVGARLRQLRLQYRKKDEPNKILSQGAFAIEIALGAEQPTVSKLETGDKKRLSLDILYTYSVACNKSIDWILTGVDEEKGSPFTSREADALNSDAIQYPEVIGVLAKLLKGGNVYSLDDTSFRTDDPIIRKVLGLDRTLKRLVYGKQMNESEYKSLMRPLIESFNGPLINCSPFNNEESLFEELLNNNADNYALAYKALLEMRASDNGANSQ